jgi:RimJ/RimL family protein N-acetyltransferase
VTEPRRASGATLPPMPHPWPLFDLRLRTERLELRPPTDDELLAVIALAARGIHPPEEMPFAIPWTDLTGPAFERGMLQHYWRTRANLGPEDWYVDFGAWRGGELVGVQGLGARGFRTLRTVHTGSWVGRAHQRQGLGREMREAVLHLAFEGLGAEVATSQAFADNVASERVSRAVGYREDGSDRRAPRGVARELRRFRLDRADWTARPRAPLAVEGLEACRPLLGA